LDKWLWAARFFKTRALAAKSCDMRRVASNGTTAKSSREVRLGDMLVFKNERGEFEVSVLVVSDVRGPGALAQTYYRETEASQERRRVLAEQAKAMAQFEVPGKLSKKDRREREKFRGR
jgi:ribosome-associated heat shock protein Hsp15